MMLHSKDALQRSVADPGEDGGDASPTGRAEQIFCPLIATLLNVTNSKTLSYRVIVQSADIVAASSSIND